MKFISLLTAKVC